MNELALVIDFAMRNALRQWRRNLMLGLAVAIGVALLMFLSALLNGWAQTLQARAIEDLTGHVRVNAAGYGDDPSAALAFPVPEFLRPALALDPLMRPDADAAASATNGVPAIARVRVPVIIRSERETRGIDLVGTDPARELGFSFLGAIQVQGLMIRRSRDPGLLIGRDLAEALETEPGRRVVLMAQDANGRTVERGITVAGVYDSDPGAYEQAFAFVGLDTAQAFLGLGDRVTEVSLRIQAGRQLTPALLQDRLAPQAVAPLEVRRWQQINGQSAAMLEMSGLGIVIWQGILITALTFGLVNTLLASVFERIREIGLVQALGMGRGSVVAQVVVESTIIMMVGLIVGLLLGALVLYLTRDGIDLTRWASGVDFFGMERVMMPVLRIEDLYSSVVLVLLLGFVGSLYPAWRAARIEPLQALSMRGG